jgi:hypothetical protein
MIPRDEDIVAPNKESTSMKKLMILALGLGVALGTISFAAPTPQDDKKTDTPKKKKKKKTTDKM